MVDNTVIALTVLVASIVAVLVFIGGFLSSDDNEPKQKTGSIKKKGKKTSKKKTRNSKKKSPNGTDSTPNEEKKPSKSTVSEDIGESEKNAKKKSKKRSKKKKKKSNKSTNDQETSGQIKMTATTHVDAEETKANDSSHDSVTMLSVSDEEGEGWTNVKYTKRHSSASKLKNSQLEDDDYKIEKSSKPTTISEVYDVGSRVGEIIGKGGCVIKMLTKKSGCHISVPKKGSLSSGEVTLEGTRSQIIVAKDEIAKILDGEDEQGDNQATTEVITLEKEHIGSVIGKKGAKVMQIEKLSGCRLKISKGVQPCTLTFTGSKEAIERAKELVNNSLNRTGIFEEHSYSCTVSKYQGSRIVGFKGLVIKEIEGETGASIKIRDDTCMISGSEEQVAAAKGKVLDIISCIRKDHFRVATEDFGLVMGKNGETIRSFEKKCNTRLYLDRDNNVIVIEGADEDIAKAKDILYKLLNTPPEFKPLKNGVKFEILELGDAIASVIGKNGTMIQKIKQETGAVLETLKKGSTECRISGSEEEVSAAMDRVQAIIDKQKEYTKKKETTSKDNSKELEDGEIDESTLIGNVHNIWNEESPKDDPSDYAQW